MTAAASPESRPGAGPRTVRGVGAVILDERGRLLLVQRGHEPARGQWSVPGGKVEPGESDREAVAREIAEETGLIVEVGGPLGSVTRPGGSGVVYEITDYDATVIAGTRAGDARAADDAADLRWVTAAEMRALPLTEGLTDCLIDWARMPR